MLVRKGITRTVFLTKKYAIKIPRLNAEEFLWSFCRGVLANISERQWSGYSDELCPVLYSFFGLVNVYPRAEEVSGVKWDDINFKTPSDFKDSNFGRLNGKLVWVDYDMDWNDCRHGSTQ